VPAAIKYLSIEPLLTAIPKLALNNIDWVIVGGESGPGSRVMEAEWVRSIRDQCQKAKVPFFFKQWGGVNKSKTGKILDGRIWQNYPTK
jgi:protein gp37